MEVKQGLMFFIVGACLSANMAIAGEAKTEADVSKEIAPATQPVLADNTNIKSELRTTEIYTAKKTETLAATNADLSKTMISKFRINGI